MKLRLCFAFLLTLCAGSLIAATAAENSAVASGEGWVPLFNGRDLSGWTVKIAKQPLGVNYADTFRVEDGIIKVAYDKYEKFDQHFGHLYTNVAYSHYLLRLEYRFTGAVLADAPHWCALNSGVMIHSQSPLSMTVDQLWPVSLEFQFLATGATAGKQTGNACTPGTHLELDGVLTTAHIIDSKSKLFPLDEWVAIELEVRGHDLVIHRVNGTEVLRYTHPQLDTKDRDAQRLLAVGVDPELGSGHIALQAEAQPVWFRNVMLRSLPK